MKRKTLLDIKDKKEKARVRDSKEYKVWSAMFNRVNSKKDYYEGVEVEKSWYNFYQFEYDFKHLINYNCIEQYPDLSWQLDKDIMAYNNNIYSRETCAFVPTHLNKFFANDYKNRKNEFSGLSVHVKDDGDKTYNAQVSMYGKSINLYTHETQLKAYNVYIAKKWEILNIYLNDIPLLDKRFVEASKETFYQQYVGQIEKNVHIL